MSAAIDQSEFEILRERFARRGYELRRVFLAGQFGSHRVTYHVTRNCQSRIFSHPHDLAGHLAVVEDLPV